MFKNVAGQKITLLAIDTATNLPKTGDSANITAYVSKDDGAVTTLTDTTAAELDATNAPGLYAFDVSQTESNADKLIFSGKSSTSGIRIIPVAIYTRPNYFSTLSIDSSGRVDVAKIGGTSQTARDIGASVLLSSGTGTGQVSLSSGAVTVGTNNDKTGYSLSQSFPTNFSSLAITAGGVVSADAVQISGDSTAANNLEAALDGTGGVTITAALTGAITGNITGSLSGSVGSVSGAVGSVTGNVGGNVVGNVGGNVSGSVGSISGVTFPTNFSAMAITAGGIVDADIETIKGQTVTCSAGVTVGAFVGNATAALTVSASGKVTVGTNDDKTGYSLTQSFPSNFSSLVISVGGVVSADAVAISGDSGAADSLEAALDGTGGVTITAGLTGNVTGNLSGSVGSVSGNVGGNVSGNVTGSVASVIGNVGGNVVGSVASVVGAVGSVTGNVGGNLVGNVNGNVVGSVASVAGAVGSVTGAVGSVTGNVGGNVVGSVGSVSSGVTLANGAITSAKFDSSTAFPLASADSGATAVARTGADGDTLETLSDQIDGVSGGGGGTDWTADEKTVIKAVLGIPVSGTTPADPTTGILDTIRDNVGTALTRIGTPTDLGQGATIADGIVELHNDTNVLVNRLGTPAGASVAADVAAVKSDTNALLSRITSTLFSGITYLSRWLGAIAGKTADSTTLTEIQATTAGAGFNNTTDSLEALRDRGDAAWTTATGFSTHSAADVWAVGTRTITGGTITTYTGNTPQTGDAHAYLTANVGTNGANLTAADDAVLSAVGALSIPTAGAIADAVWDEATSGHLTAGTTGAKLNSLSAGGDATAANQTTIITHLTDIKGGGWSSSTDTLEKIRDALPVSTGAGAYTLTVTVNDGTTALQNATVRLSEGANAFAGLTNASGVVAFSLDAATYDVAITKDGYSFNPTTKVVAGSGSQTYSMTAVVITPSADPGKCVATMTCFNNLTNDDSTARVWLQQTSVPAGDDGHVFDAKKIMLTPNSDGEITVTLWRGAGYKIWRGSSEDDAVEFTAASAATMSLDSVLGKD